MVDFRSNILNSLHNMEGRCELASFFADDLLFVHTGDWATLSGTVLHYNDTGRSCVREAYESEAYEAIEKRQWR